MTFEAQDPQFEQRIRGSFARQKAMNILTPGRGALVAKGQVLKPGRTLTVARAEVYSRDGKHVASMQQTLMMLAGTPDTKE
jgi:hypothetical protein